MQVIQKILLLILWSLQSKSVGNIYIYIPLRQLWGLAPLTHGDVVLLLSDSLPLLVNLKQRFMTFIHKALNHKSYVISNVAKLSIQFKIHGRIVAVTIVV